MNRRDFITGSAAALCSLRGIADSRDQTMLFAPAEESPHSRTWMCWPSTPWIYGETEAYFRNLQENLGLLAASIVRHEPVSMLAASEHHALARKLCGPTVELVDIPTDDMWARDTGPIFLVSRRGGLAALDLNFNGWGGRQRHHQDRKVASAIADYLGIDAVNSSLVGEGGGVEHDGEGTLLLTESCWVNANRNPGKSRDEIEQDLKRGFGAEKVIWLPGVRGQDITDGHIDGSIRIVRPGVLMTSGYQGDYTEWGRVLRESIRILKSETDARGRQFEIASIPAALYPRSEHPEMFTSYANYYVGNGAVYTPEFGMESADRFAVEMLGKLYPDRKVVALNVDRIYENGGGIHCVTQQQPQTL